MVVVAAALALALALALVALVAAVVALAVVGEMPPNVRACDGIAVVSLRRPIGTEDRATRSTWQRCRDSVDHLHPLPVPLESMDQLYRRLQQAERDIAHQPVP